jgi:hypothetical protein
MAPRKKAAAKKVVKKQFYTIQFEKYMEVLEDVNKTYFIISDKVRDLVLTMPVEKWADSPISEFLDSFVLVDSFRYFLEDKVNNPTEEEIEFTVKYNIKDILFNKEELQVMQQFFLTVESRKEYLLNNYNFSCFLN